jgi:outer membrane protein W
MRLFLSTTVAAVFTVSAAPTAFADGGPTGIELGFRTGYALPFGDASGSSSVTTTAGGTTVTTTTTGSSLSDGVSGQIPLWVDAGYRITPNFYVGGFVQYGFAFIPNNASTGCGQSGVSCSGHDVMFGVDAHYHIMPDAPFDPWVGLGFGYEILTFNLSQGSQSADVSASGWQLVNFQLGGDYHVMPNFGVGPFVALSLGQYSSASRSIGGTSTSNDIANKAMHEWLTFGLRAVYDISVL